MKRNLFLLLSFLVISMIVILFNIWNLAFNSSKQNSDSPFITYTKTPHFHPDSVVEFSFSIYDEVLSFKRKNRLGTWFGPNHTPRSIQERLLFIATAKVTPIDAIKDAIITIRIRLDNHQEWSAVSNGKMLRFETGPLSGMGGRLDNSHSLLFLTGRHSFKERKINWCSSRPVSFKNSDFEIKYTDKKWIKTHIDNKVAAKKELNQTTIEKWIGRNCYVFTRRILDERLIDLQTKRYKSIDFNFNNKKATLSWTKNIVKIEGEDTYYFSSQHFIDSLNTLNSLL